MPCVCEVSSRRSCQPSELLQECDHGKLVVLAEPAPAPEDLTCVAAILL